MLGSHNSLTYLPCRKWWMYLINWAAKCQNQNLCKQFEKGVRYFDLRVRFTEKGTPVIAHGLVEYKGNIGTFLMYLELLAKRFNETVCVRFVLEFNKKPKDWILQTNQLNEMVSRFRGSCPRLTYDYTMTKWNEQDLIRYNHSMVYLLHKYSSVLGWKRFLWIPWVYAKLHNKDAKETYKEIVNSKGSVLMLDFV